MFKIYGDATEFHQWAMDYALTNEHMSVGDRVVFRNTCGGQRVMYAYDEGGTVMVNVPNQLLQDDKRVIVSLDGHPGCTTAFDIIPGDKPETYDELYTEADRHDPKDLESMVKTLVANGGGSGGGSAGGNVVVVTCTITGQNGLTITGTCDMNATQIKAFMDTGRVVYIYTPEMGGMTQINTTLTNVASGELECVRANMLEMSHSDSAVLLTNVCIDVQPDGSVTIKYSRATISDAEYTG